MISWEAKLDGHIKGVAVQSRAIWWLRFDRKDQVIGIYRIVGDSTSKLLVPKDVENTESAVKAYAERVEERINLINASIKRDSQV